MRYPIALKQGMRILTLMLLLGFHQSEKTIGGIVAANQSSDNTFVLEFSTSAGPQLGTNLQRYQTRLILRSKEQEIFLEKHRSASDEPSEAIGTFRQHSVDLATFAAVFDLMQEVDLINLPPPMRGGPGTSVMTLKLKQGDQETVKLFTSMDIELIEQLEPLLEELNHIAFELWNHPEAALLLKVKHLAGEKDGQFQLSFKNIGSQTLHITKPETLELTGEDQFVGVQIAEFPQERPGFTSPPLGWERLAITQNNTNVPERILLLPKEMYTVTTLAWQAKRKGQRYLVQAIFSDYVGAINQEVSYPLRGALFSEAIERIP